MIKKPSHYQPYVSKATQSYAKSENSNQNNIHKKLFPTNTHHPTSTFTPKTHQSRPLQQITNSLPLTHKQPKPDRTQKYLKSQTSITDLSQIVAIEISSAQKKDSNIRLVQTVQKPLTSDGQNIDAFQMKRAHNYTFPQQSEDNSLRLDEFQILDIYQATAIKSHQQMDAVSDLRNRRKSGGIRRNSRVSVNMCDQLSRTDASSRNSELNRPTITEREFEQKLSSRSSSQAHTRRTSVDISQILDEDIRKCGQKLFSSININKKSLTQTDLQRARLTCEMRLILGPILTKFKQKKYSELNLSSFNKQFASIMKDFSPKECLEIVKKIEGNKHLEGHSQENFQQSESLYVNEPQPVKYLPKTLLKFSEKEKFSEKGQLSMKEVHSKYQKQQISYKQEDSAQNRLEKLTSKVNSFLSKISNQQNSRYQVSDKHKVSTLMSRLTQIEQISGDSEDLISKRDSIQNEITEIDEITKDVYMEISERRVTEEGECESKYCMESQAQNEDDEKSLQEKDRFQRDQFVLDQPQSYNRGYNPFRKQVVYPPYEGFSSAESTKRKLFNQTQSISMQRNSYNKRIYERLFPQSSPEQTSRISFKTINLQFSQLSKYLY